eukprot:GHUV01038813.1.p1 GENE.GHUV01038813.1~~GHUV01038813.1.p1  ORF type:complete len:314 (+),score=52.43 GHUV01038813.1:280-1221(+)
MYYTAWLTEHIHHSPPNAGQFAQSLPGSGQVPGGFYWSGGYWGYCPPPSPPAITPAPPPPPGVTTSFIKSPQSGQSFQTGPNGFAAVLLDATGSVPAPNRRIVAYGWVVKSATDGTPRATATGVTSTLQLPPGQYVVTLNVVDNTGANSQQGPVRFMVVGAGQIGGPAGIGPNPVMMAVIKSPPQIVLSGRDGGNVSIPLDATGSLPAPGFLVDRYSWTVSTQQAGNQVLLSQQTVKQANAATVSLPVGSYIVTLVVVDTGGRNSTLTKVRVVSSTLIQSKDPAVFIAAVPKVRCGPTSALPVTLGVIHRVNI